MNKITIFTFNDHRDQINTPLHQMCIETWSKIVTYLKKLGYDCDIKIFTEDSEEYKFIYNDYLQYHKDFTGLASHVADVFRIYVLSKYPYYLWIDWDVYIRDNFELDIRKPYLMRSFYFIFNKDKTDIFEYIYNSYKRYNLIRMCDSQITDFLETFTKFNYNYNPSLCEYLVHLNFIDNDIIGREKYFYFINTEEEQNEFVKQHINDKKNFKFINKDTKKHKGIFGLNGEQKIIDFILKHYELTEVQRKKLLE